MPAGTYFLASCFIPTFLACTSLCACDLLVLTAGGTESFTADQIVLATSVIHSPTFTH